MKIKNKINTGNAFNRDQFGIEDNHKSTEDGKALFWVFLQIGNQRFNP